MERSSLLAAKFQMMSFVGFSLAESINPLEVTLDSTTNPARLGLSCTLSGIDYERQRDRETSRLIEFDLGILAGKICDVGGAYGHDTSFQ